MSRITQSLIGAALAVLVNAIAALSLAGTPAPEQHSLTVHYGDLSLDRPADVTRLYQRITTAAKEACGPREFTGSHLELPSYRSCFDLAVANAVAAVASPGLSAYYQAQRASRAHTATLARR